MTRIGSLFSGSGMLDVAVHQVLGAEPAWFVENDPAASRVLEHHWPNVPNYGDITAVDWAVVESADVLIGGPPCQDVSSAGKRLGLRPDTRSGLWSHMAYAVSVLRPRLVVIENVRGLLSADAHCEVEPCPWCVGDGTGRLLRACGSLVGDLSSLGYVGRIRGLRAADVGAPHGRFRVFITARPAGNSTVLGWHPAQLAYQRRESSGEVRGSNLATSDPESNGRREGRAEPSGLVGGSDAAQRGDAAPANADCIGTGQNDRGGRPTTSAREASRTEWGSESGSLICGGLAWGPYESAIRRWESVLGRPAPPPTMTGKRSGQQLSPLFVEWMMGWPQGWVTDVPGLSRNDQLKICGNGVVPQQAAATLSWLLTSSCERAA